MYVLTTGILVVDIIAAELPHIADQGELLYVTDGITVTIGGHAGNVSIDLIQLGVRIGDVYLASVVGRDVFGDFIERFLSEKGVKVRLMKVDAPTSKNIILVVKGEDRRFHVDIGSNIFLDRVFIEEAIDDIEPRILYVGGAGMLGRFDDHLPYILGKARNIDAITFLDIVAPYSRDWSFFRNVIGYSDIFHCNSLEAYRITGEEDVFGSLKLLRRLGCKLPVITMGDKGLVASFKDKLMCIPAFKVDVIDPTGAGDAFCAGLIFKFTEKLGAIDDYMVEEIADWLIFGSASGAACCTAKGTTTNVRRKVVDAILNAQLDDLMRNIQVKDI
ncbi:MAG: carbohydrate kinase family protein [Candidatus Bathyarchaeota archaeon]|nr:carbohydrate kinase family protein [Candidatus Bathyarchaeota archaeon]